MRYRKTPRKHQTPSKIVLLLPLFSLFCTLRPCSECSQSCTIKRGREERNPSTTQQNEEHNKPSRPDGAGVLPMLLAYQAGCKRERKPTRQDNKGQEKEGKRNERKAATSPQAPQRKGHPPHRQGAGNPSPHHKFAPKNQQKVAWGGFEKIFGKIFRGNVSG